MDLAIKTFLEWHFGEFCDLKKHCISYPTKSLILISVNHYFSFRIKQELLIVYSYKFICVYIISLSVNITKIGTRPYYCRFTQSKPDKESQVAV